jgi:DNA-directed RNA polymerase specialized sigma24 family protein
LTFILRHYEGYKFEEIAELMGVTSGAAKANHHHAVMKLRNLLKEWL